MNPTGNHGVSMYLTEYNEQAMHLINFVDGCTYWTERIGGGMYINQIVRVGMRLNKEINGAMYTNTITNTTMDDPPYHGLL